MTSPRTVKIVVIVLGRGLAKFPDDRDLRPIHSWTPFAAPYVETVPFWTVCVADDVGRGAGLGAVGTGKDDAVEVAL